MNRPIQRPFLERRNTNAHVQKQGRSCGSNVFGANTFVYLTGAALLAAIPTGGTACYGWAHAPSVGAQQDFNAPGMMPNLYANNYPFDLKEDSLIVMSTTNAAGDTASTGNAATAPALSTVQIGQSYGILNPTTGPLAGVQMVNLSDTTNALVTVVALYPNQATTDLNGLVLVRLVPTAFQA